MKKWKIVQIIGFLILVIGVITRVGGEYVGTFVAIVGLLVFVVGRLAAWLNEP